MMDETPKPEYQTVPGIQRHPLFHLLTEKQQDFLLAYIGTDGNRMEAIRKAYGNIKRPDVSSLRILRSPYVRKLISIYYNYEIDMTPMGRQELAGLIAARIRKNETKDNDFWRLVDLLMELTGRRSKETKAEKEDPTPATGGKVEDFDDLVHRLEQNKRKKD